MTTLDQEILSAVERVLPRGEGTVLLHAPYMPPNAAKYVQECVETGWVSSAGAYVTRFEQMLAEITGCKRAVAVVNGTAALEMCFRLSGVRLGDEVLAPSLTFVATANAISHCGAIPHFVDVSFDRLSICPEALETRLREIAAVGSSGETINRETGKRISALCLMHCFGHPGDIDAIDGICQRYNITLLEDAAESLGSIYKGEHTGRVGKMAAISFNGNKIVTTGGGGAILTDDEELADQAKHLTTTGKIPHPWEFHHDQVAWNFRMPNINAALGVAQLEELERLLHWKRKLTTAYVEALAGLTDVEVVQEPADSRSNYWLNALRLQGATLELRDQVLKRLNDAGYQSRPIWEPMHRLPMYSSAPRGDLRKTEQLRLEIVNIPSSAQLGEKL